MEEQKKAKAALLGLLARRDYPSEVLKQKLLAKGFSETVVEKMICWAKEKGFVNDEQYVQALIKKEIRQGRSPRMIRYKLHAKKLPQEEADQIDDETQKDQIRKLLPKLSPDPRKAMQSLYRRGFDAALISEIFRE